MDSTKLARILVRHINRRLDALADADADFGRFAAAGAKTDGNTERRVYTKLGERLAGAFRAHKMVNETLATKRAAIVAQLAQLDADAAEVQLRLDTEVSDVAAILKVDTMVTEAETTVAA
jgi:hypothetical protein